MKRSSLAFWLLLMVGCGAFCGWSFVRENRATQKSTEPAASPANTDLLHWPPLADFKLTDQRGQEFDSASLRGRVWVASFFFTNCPAICWRLNQAIAGLQDSPGDGDVRFVSITCDPDNDTPQALDRYAKHFKADPDRWTFLTGDIKKLRDIANQQFHVALDKGTHSDRVFVIDRTGRIRAMVSLTEPGQAERLKKLIAKFAAQPESTAASQVAVPDANE